MQIWLQQWVLAVVAGKSESLWAKHAASSFPPPLSLAISCLLASVTLDLSQYALDIVKGLASKCFGLCMCSLYIRVVGFFPPSTSAFLTSTRRRGGLCCCVIIPVEVNTVSP